MKSFLEPSETKDSTFASPGPFQKRMASCGAVGYRRFGFRNLAQHGLVTHVRDALCGHSCRQIDHLCIRDTRLKEFGRLR